MKFCRCLKKAVVYLTDDVGHSVSRFDLPSSLRVDPQSHVHVRETLLIRVVLRVLRQGLRTQTCIKCPSCVALSSCVSSQLNLHHLVDLKHAERDAAIGHLLPNLDQMLLDVLKDRVPVLV